MSEVLAVGGAQKWASGEGVTYWVTLDDRTEDVPCYDDKAAALEVHKPLPDGWEVKKSSKGKDYLATPKAAKGGGGFAAAFKNTREGMLIEQDSINRSVALKAAIKAFGHPDVRSLDTILEHAEKFYQWLSSGADLASVSPAAGGVVATHPAPPASPSVIAPAIGGEVEGVGELGEGLPAPIDPRTCKHTATSPLAPSGRALKEGRVRCLDCGLIVEEAKV
jgi:hypothetical protein